MQAPIEIPNFVLEKEIGEGGMAKVYLARQIEPKRKVAIKIVAPATSQDDAFIQSLKQEGDTAAQFSHDHIVTIYACGVIDGHYYMAMEILSGGDLSQRIKQGLDEKSALTITRQMASALGLAHQRNTLHRDIKPENILFHESGKAVLVDFGIAKDADTTSNFTKAGAVVGTPHYMAPERVTGKSVDARSDLYALGVVLYEMLTGKKLYEGKDTFAISYAHVYDEIPPLPADKAHLQPLLDRMLAKSPDDRFQDAEELIAEIDAYLAHSATPTGNRPKTRRTSRAPSASPSGSSKWLVTGLVSVLLVAAAGVAWFGGLFDGQSNDTTADSLPDGSRLEPAERIRVQELLDSARSFVKIKNYDQAEANYHKVLTEYNCFNTEARSGYRALRPDEYETLIRDCE